MLPAVTPVKTQRDIMELEKLTHTREEAREFPDTIHALVDGDRFRDEPTTFIRETDINVRTGLAVLKELEIVKLIVGMAEGRKRKYSTFKPRNICNLYIIYCEGCEGYTHLIEIRLLHFCSLYIMYCKGCKGHALVINTPLLNPPPNHAIHATDISIA